MPVTHGVAGSSPVRTAKKPTFIVGFFIYTEMYYTYILYSPSDDKIYIPFTFSIPAALWTARVP